MYPSLGWSHKKYTLVSGMPTSTSGMVKPISRGESITTDGHVLKRLTALKRRKQISHPGVLHGKKDKILSSTQFIVTNES